MSVGVPLKLPCCLECVLDGTGVTSGEIRDDHHVLDKPGRDAEGLGKLSHYRVAVVEIGADHHMGVVKLARYQPAVVPQLSQPLWRGEANTWQGLSQARYVTHLHERGPSLLAFESELEGTYADVGHHPCSPLGHFHYLTRRRPVRRLTRDRSSAASGRAGSAGGTRVPAARAVIAGLVPVEPVTVRPVTVRSGAGRSAAVTSGCPERGARGAAGVLAAARRAVAGLAGAGVGCLGAVRGGGLGPGGRGDGGERAGGDPVLGGFAVEQVEVGRGAELLEYYRDFMILIS